MTIRKTVCLCILGVTLMLTLTGCTTVENQVKKIEKDIDVASINNLDSNNEKSVEEKKNLENKKDNNVKEVRYVNMTGENGPYVVVYGYGNNGQIIWEYKSKTDTIGGQLCYVGFVLHDANYGSVIIQELNTIKALDDRTGKEKWTFEGFEGSAQGTTDQDGNIYLYTLGYSRLYVIDKNGKLKKCIDIEKLIPQGACLPVLHIGVSEVSIYNATEKKISVIYDVIDSSDNDGTVVTESTKRMIIDTINEKVKIENIETRKSMSNLDE